MKTLLLLLLSCLPLCAATTYTVLSDNTNRTIKGGTTNLSLLNATNQVFTGTNSFPAASFYPANMIGQRVLWASPTNIYIPTVTVNATANATNSGDYVNTTSIGYGYMPPLLSSNSFIVLQHSTARTNAVASGLTAYFYVGEATNLIGSGVFASATTIGNTLTTGAGVVSAGGSMTNWLQGTSYPTPLIAGPYPFFDGSVSNRIYIGITTSTSHTNALIYGLRLVEFFSP
tara:strand:+ start:685 stop:1374 length:690 start_codon:yes stop_codon:yes gene_type:complete